MRRVGRDRSSQNGNLAPAPRPSRGLPRRPLIDEDFTDKDRARFWDTAKRSKGCWRWTGPLARPSRYGVFTVGTSRYYAHRVAYLFEYGEDPGTWQVMHTCDVRDCVRPDHLVLATVRERIALQRARGRRPVGAEHPSART